ncbi:glycosyltransferase family 4 protein [Candidatus Kuenenbacteria bacterium]|nr:glycosyltransferase family 4 protein [Candidatus Kuenenbacteria bacterium]
MKICLINNLYPPYNRGGAERVVENQAQEFVTAGHEVFIITSRPIQDRSQAGSEKIKVYRFFPPNIISYYHLQKLPFPLRAPWRLFDTFNFHSYFKIKKILQTEKPDIVYAHNLTGLGLLIPRLIKKLKIKYTQTMHDVVGIRPSGLLLYGQEKENIFIKFWTSLNRWLYSSPDKVIFPSVWLKKYYEGHKFFPHGPKEAAQNFYLPSANLLLNKKLKSPDKVTFLYIGQIESHKGILFLIQTLNELLVTSYELLILGSGSQLESAKDLAKSNSQIKFLGYQPKEKIQEYLKQADYTIVPSLCYEASPTVIFESLAVGVPVIASNLGGIPELIRVGEKGYLFEPGNKKQLLEIIEDIYATNQNAKN